MTTTRSSHQVEIDFEGRRVAIEHRWIGGAADDGPVIVFLHEGLGSVAMWKDFPDALCAATGSRGLAYSRPGYGRSTPRPRDERWAPDFMHAQAHALLPALRRALGLDGPVWLFGHSDGGSIALLHAARFPQAVRGLVVLAPHVLVEPVSIASIEEARDAYAEGGLRERLAKYHDDVDSAFGGWNGIWLAPAFASWNIEAELATINAPLLAVQGIDDEYGTLEQIRRIAARVPRTTLLELPHCGHSPHRDQPQAVIDACRHFMGDHR